MTLCVQMLLQSPNSVFFSRSLCLLATELNCSFGVTRFTHAFFCVKFERVFLAVAQPVNHGDESGRYQLCVSAECCGAVVVHASQAGVDFLSVDVFDVPFVARRRNEGWTACDGFTWIAIETPQDSDDVSVYAILFLTKFSSNFTPFCCSQLALRLIVLCTHRLLCGWCSPWQSSVFVCKVKCTAYVAQHPAQVFYH